jgi:sugar/nucleoside kinase (ribokinase family)
VSAEQPRLLHVGNVLVDVLPDGTTAPGGGLNVLVAARRQGMAAAYGGMHGTGPFGDLCRAALAAAGVDILQPVVPEQDTGRTVAHVDPSGEYTFVTSPGAEARLTADRLAALTVRPNDVVHVSGYGLAYPVNGPALAGWLSTLDPQVTVLVDPGPLVADIPAPVLAAVLARADWWSCNEREARFPGAGRVGTIVRTGARGCVLRTANEQVRVPPFPVTAVDTNGAGDTHVGVFAAGLAAGLDPSTAALRANAAAALAVTKRGPSTAPTSAEIDGLLARSLRS